METVVDDWIVSGRGELLLLFNYWYDTKKFPKKKTPTHESVSGGATSTRAFAIDSSQLLPASHLRRQWREVWFAKGDRQAEMDRYLLQYEPLFSRFEAPLLSAFKQNNRRLDGEEQEVMNLELKLEHGGSEQRDLLHSDSLSAIEHPVLLANALPLLTHFDTRLGLLILFDQVSRNIFRGKPNAYQYDVISRAIALGLLTQQAEWRQLAIQYKFSVLICLLHTEDLAVQKLVRNECETLVSDPALVDYLEMTTRLKQIAFNHYDRVVHFGRIPERNRILGRPPTDRETEYLSAIGTSFFMDL